MIGTYFIIIAVIIGLAFLGLGISTFFGFISKNWDMTDLPVG